ncbi:hypothetical protein [Ruegeria sp. AU67]|uniref:hypothetical protein n=1 Tax=Ruegeria sp. AU67 TaxID=2108530 RepID=UPI0013587E3F|nr:hypothetical protein [Ruegeria sp. AU67]
MDRSPLQFTAQAANAPQGANNQTQIALRGLLKLMARAEVQAVASQPTANLNHPIKETP